MGSPNFVWVNPNKIISSWCSRGAVCVPPPSAPPAGRGTPGPPRRPCLSETAIRLAQNVQVGPCIPVGKQLEKAEVGPTSRPTWRLPHSSRVGANVIRDAALCILLVILHAKYTGAREHDFDVRGHPRRPLGSPGECAACSWGNIRLSPQ
jgi:hypothetical protein